MNILFMEENEKEPILLEYRMFSNLERKYERMDTGEFIDEKYVHLMGDNLIGANGLILDGEYCHIDEEALKKQEEYSGLGSGLTIE